MRRMEFIAGAIHPETGMRFVCTGHAMPTVADLVYLISNVPPEICNWGEEATPDAVAFLANLLLRQYGAQDRCVVQYITQQLVAKMASGKMWLLERAVFEEWISSAQAACQRVN